ncbi:hypothetical protein AC249_AIPGENE8460 [Exaiptasia diaphana]|nr:hypothetical protein AC249_AIPGENE8460 [Exaiptasia diaphana]
MLQPGGTSDSYQVVTLHFSGARKGSREGCTVTRKTNKRNDWCPANIGRTQGKCIDKDLNHGNVGWKEGRQFSLSERKIAAKDIIEKFRTCRGR